MRPEASIRVIVNGSSLLLQLKAIGGLPETSTVTVTIAAASDATGDVLKEALEKLETTALIDRPITFALDADGRLIAGVGYTERTIPLHEAVESNKTTAVWIDATGGLHFAPSIFTGVTNGNKPAVTIRSPYDGLYTVIRSDKSFADMNGHWAQQEIELLANKRIVEGQPDGQFAPNDSITRAEFAELLVRALGLPEATSQPSFSDVDSASWFSGAVGAARQAGLIDGYGDGTFQPDAHITREQMAVMIGRALAYAGKSPEADSGMLQTFADGSDIAGWAADAAAQAAGTGIIQGMAGAAFAPEAEASRAQSAVMLQRMLAYLQFINN
ncbi:S-layer homology domain-containing protein [Paenibacillus sp. TAB 01]|uniref:S-layer homology domain-containing protein n=1 Tax=Paenibacillus sp. TAB 01 TaxID=3368988 RepID=UPI0037531A5D